MKHFQELEALAQGGTKYPAGKKLASTKSCDHGLSSNRIAKLQLQYSIIVHPLAT
jgi:hypothetical protein